MNPLLRDVLDASGGVDRWSRTDTVTAELSLGGPIWAAKGWSDAVRNLTVTVEPRRQRTVITPFTSPELTMEYDNTAHTALEGTPPTGSPQRVVLRDSSGEVVQERTDPRAAFVKMVRSSPWDALHLGYFIGYAMWNYLTTPCLFLRPDVRTEEIEPWHEAGQTWRRLRVTYPETFATHSLEQTFYFDPDGLHRRMDYTNEVLGSALVAHYVGHHRTFGGLVYPTRRRTFRRNPDGTSNLNLPSITIDIHNITTTESDTTTDSTATASAA